MSVEIENIKKDIRMRAETDSMMSTAWILVYLLPIIAVILYVIVFIAILISILITTIPTYPSPGQPITPPQLEQLEPLYASIVFLYLIAIITAILFIILAYKLVKRRNKHFKRQIFLFEDIVAAIKTIAAKKGVNVEVSLASYERTLRETKADETESEKSAMLWAILSTFNILALLYIWYFLMKDFYKHERREDAFWEDISRLLDKCGIKFSVPRRIEPLLDRSFVLYLILTIITFGLFGIYWLYVLLKDPNQHFRYHIQIEDPLLSALETVAI